MSGASRLREEPHASERRRERRRPAAVVPPPATWRGASTRPRRGGDAAATRRRRGGDPLAATPNEHPGSSGDCARRPWCARRRCPEAEMPTVPGHTSARTPEHCACPARGTYHLPYRAAQSREQSSGVIEHVQSVSWCPFHQGPPLWGCSVLRILGGTGPAAARAGRAAERKKRAGSMGSSDTHTELSKCRIRESE
jgi:hypothetical protein